MNNQSNLVFPTALDNDTELSLTYLLEEATILVKDLLQQFANKSDFIDRMQLAFGENTDVSQLKASWQAGEFVFPQIEIVAASDINGANGAYAIQTNKIYLAQEFLLDNQRNIPKITDVFLEEYGHFIDAEINSYDTAGDEGAIFAEIVRGNLLTDRELQRLIREDDELEITIDNEKVTIDQSIDEIKQIGVKKIDIPNFSHESVVDISIFDSNSFYGNTTNSIYSTIGFSGNNIFFTLDDTYTDIVPEGLYLYDLKKNYNSVKSK